MGDPAGSVGLKAGWLTALFRFAPRPAERRFVHPRHTRALTVKDGFVGFACDRMMIGPGIRTRRQITERTVAHLRRSAQRARRVRS